MPHVSTIVEQVAEIACQKFEGGLTGTGFLLVCEHGDFRQASSTLEYVKGCTASRRDICLGDYLTRSKLHVQDIRRLNTSLGSLKLFVRYSSVSALIQEVFVSMTVKQLPRWRSIKHNKLLQTCADVCCGSNLVNMIVRIYRSNRRRNK